MKRTSSVAIWVLGAIITAYASVPVAAPIPKHIQPAKPTKLTPAMLTGSWSYEWSTMLHGVIEFRDDGTYTAQHHQGSDTIYSGTWAIGENSITIVEWNTSTRTGTTNGPTCYRFDVEMKDWPALTGKSTGGMGFNIQVIPEATNHLKLHGRK